MLPEDPNIRQIDQGFSVVFLSSRLMLLWFPNVLSQAALAKQNFKISAQTQPSHLIFCHPEAVQTETPAKLKIFSLFSAFPYCILEHFISFYLPTVYFASGLSLTGGQVGTSREIT